MMKSLARYQIAIKLQYGKIWEEYQKQESPESKIVHQIDKLEMVLQAKMYQKEGAPVEAVESFFKSAESRDYSSKIKRTALTKLYKINLTKIIFSMV